MTVFILSPPALPKASAGELEMPVPKLDVTDARDDYCTSDGDGLWIEPFIGFLEEQVAERTYIRHFQFSDTERLDEHLLAEVKSTHVRALLIEFINTHYERWRDNDLDRPDYDSVREECRGWCDECDSGWHELHAEYEGPLAEDVEPDEIEEAPGISVEERQARRRRNIERRRERARREAAREEAESEVLDRELICEDDCDSFLDHINEQYRDAFDPNTTALKPHWEEFIADRGEKAFPPLHAISADQ